MMSLSLLVVVYSYHSLSLALLEVGVSGVIVARVVGVAIEPYSYGYDLRLGLLT